MKFSLLFKTVIFLLAITGFLLITKPGWATGSADVDGNGVINARDLLQIIDVWGEISATRPEDINEDFWVNGMDAAWVIKNWGETVISVTPTPTPSASTLEWSQFGYNPQRINWTPVEINRPWRFKWQWNAAGPDGKTQPASHLTVPHLVQPITGGGRVYMVADNRIFALSAHNGQVLWSQGNLGGLLATPAYEQEWLYLPSTNGVYKLNAASGEINASFTGSGGFETPPLIAGDRIYVVSQPGYLYALNKASLNAVWQYTAGSAGATMPAYSSKYGVVVFVSQDLYVHCVGQDGLRRWRTKPTPRQYGEPARNNKQYAQAQGGWPVIAEEQGLVLLKLRLDWNTVYTWSPFPDTNQEIRANLISQPGEQSLFALRLNSGEPAFIPAVGNTGEEGWLESQPILSIGSPPIIAEQAGRQVAYVIYRNGQSCVMYNYCDGRWDATLGEMLLDGNTITGYEAGDVRFIAFENPSPSDEVFKLNGSGAIIFHNHWQADKSRRIINRSSQLGNSFNNPIQTEIAPYVVWSACDCDGDCNPRLYPGGSGYGSCFGQCHSDITTHYCSSLYTYGDQRSYPAGFYEYLNDRYQDTWPKYAFTVVSDGMILYRAPDGGLTVLEAGNPY
ncbi:PQQ-binding-like beta-propeller repeat protein [Patescibacteria group bacterium]|nr:PQQ-binding-like beta-propeller repeat protein [Patescibacteria group bacterium]MBU1931331.1 PQQ-binding-like beta-propeller repeat protein [Patescibacteria group bacterium]